jgi:PilZ domain
LGVDLLVYGGRGSMGGRKSMRAEKRKAVRRSVCQGGTIVGIDGLPLGACLVLDISAAGARLVVKPSVRLPDQFTVVLSRSGQLRRSCSVVWRSENALGVKFLPSEWTNEKQAGLPSGQGSTLPVLGRKIR